MKAVIYKIFVLEILCSSIPKIFNAGFKISRDGKSNHYTGGTERILTGLVNF